jgi:ribonuclease E
MPNTTHGGGISRKISNVADRKRLKSIMAELQLPPSMGCIVRTAGLQRTKTEIRRDFDYLARVWDGIRETTLKSSAPALIYGDSDLIKRAIRDIYNRDIEEVIVEGDDGYRSSREFMKLLMPSHARKVKPYADAVPLFQRFGVEDQLNAMYQPVVQLKSGGYLVINPTEALVSIDINSGRSTREHGIEATAVGTNLEAAQEIARQLRLRDMAGLVVIDFIDMEHGSNVRKVEKAMKAALANDRARIQVGRISSFGLMEMSRQRLRTGVLEASTRPCPHCEGSGFVRTASSAGLSALRLLEDEAARGRGSVLTLRASQEATIYVLNRKRAELAEIEDRYGVSIEVLPDGETEGAKMSVEPSGPPPAYRPKIEPIVFEDDDDDLPLDDEIEEEEESTEETARGRDRDREDGDGRRRRSRRRRGRKGRREDGTEGSASDTDGDDGEASEGDEQSAEAREAEAPVEGDEGRTRSRRGRRGGRNRRSRRDSEETQTGEAADAGSDDNGAQEAPVDAEPVAEDAPAEKPKRRSRAKKAVAAEDAPVAEAAEAEAEAVVEDAPAEKPKRRSRAKKADAVVEAVSVEHVSEVAPAADAPAEKPKRKSRAKKAEAVVDTAPAEAEPVTAVEAAPADAEPEGPPRRGWWQRTFGDGN